MALHHNKYQKPTTNGKIRVLAHYYVDPERNYKSTFRQRICVEVRKIPSPGEIVLLQPEWMDMNETPIMGPGLYRVKEVRPNKDYPETVYDYSPYNSYFSLEKMKMIIVDPVYTVHKRYFKDYTFDVKTEVDENGIVKETAVVINLKTGEVKEQEL